MNSSPINAKKTNSKSPWHAGETAIQASIGVVDRMEMVGKRVIRNHMPVQHREFYHQLPFIVAGVVDEDNQPWATLLVKEPGFITTPNSSSLQIGALPADDDPALTGFRKGAGIGFLGIELHTRRRNRVNGKIKLLETNTFDVQIEQSMGNCHKYISLRHLQVARDPQTPSNIPAESLSALDDKAAAKIRAADTFFVASFTEDGTAQNVDVSHRGGKAGFVRVNADGSLTIPDFSGNLFFNTLGNILLNGKAGLIFPDFETGDVLQMTGTAEIILDSPEITAFEGAERLWTFKPTQIIRRAKALPLKWTSVEASPYNLSKGSWDAVEDNLRKARELDD